MVQKSSGDDLLHASQQTIETLNSADYWLQLCPFLTIHSNVADSEVHARVQYSERKLDYAKQRVIQDGFVRLDEVEFSVDLELIVAGIKRLIQFGWDPLFIAVYNEPWVMAHQLSAAIKHITGGNQFNLDFLAWCIDPRLGQKGKQFERFLNGSMQCSWLQFV